jgi:hypothetical protein
MKPGMDLVGCTEVNERQEEKGQKKKRQRIKLHREKKGKENND